MNKKKVALICVHNSCRSQIAEALGKYLASDIFESYSAGTETKPRINQDTVRIMKETYGIDMEANSQHSKLITDIPDVDIAISMGCNVGCPFIGRAALYKNPEIIILDEATSSLDNIAENQVKIVMEVMKDAGKTVIIIAHRLSTVKHADRIIVLHNGEVKEEGTHEELSQKDGLYRKLWKEQFEVLK